MTEEGGFGGSAVGGGRSSYGEGGLDELLGFLHEAGEIEHDAWVQ